MKCSENTFVPIVNRPRIPSFILQQIFIRELKNNEKIVLHTNIDKTLTPVKWQNSTLMSANSAPKNIKRINLCSTILKINIFQSL